MTGFGVSATLGLPDAGLISAGEMVQAGSIICDNLPSIPCIGDGDTVRSILIRHSLLYMYIDILDDSSIHV